MSVTKYLKRGIRYILNSIPTENITANISYLSPDERLKGKKIIVTGGGRGIGYAMSRKFKEEGAEVLIAGRNEGVLRESAQQLKCKYLQLDVQNIDSFTSFIDKADEVLDGINCLVNNAGISLHENSFLDVSQAQFDMQFHTNLKGAFFLTQSFIKYCSKHNGSDMKNILFVSSETGILADDRPYGLTKAAMNSLIQGLAYRYVNKGYRINAVAPGVTISDMVGKKDDGVLTFPGNITGRYYKPEEIAEVACFLLSDASNCINGQILICNEGKTINTRFK